MSETIAEKKSHQQGTKRIWKVFWILCIITAVEVILGIKHPLFLEEHHLWHMELLNWIFIGLTIVKAYYIVWTFMHMETEAATLRRTVVWSIVFYVAYIIFIFLAEGNYINNTIHDGYVLWNF